MAKLYSLLILAVAQISFATAEIGIKFNSTSINNSDTITVSNVNIGSTQNFNFEIQNTGIDTLRLNSVSQNSGTDFILVQPTQNKLAKDSIINVSFSFTPTCESVNKFTTVTINSNSTLAPIFTLVIKGKSVDTELPEITCPANIERCSEQTINYSLPTFSDNCTISGTPSLILGKASGETFSIGTTTQTYRVLDDQGNANQCSFDIIIHAPPTNAVISSSAKTICDSSFMLTANTPTVGTGYWTRISNQGTINDSLSASTELTDIPYGNSKYAWNIQNGTCPVSSDTITISRDIETTVANAGLDQDLCDDNSTTLAANNNGNWTKTLGGGNIDSPNNSITQVSFISPGLNQFVWTINSSNSCPNSSDTINVKNSRKPQSGAIAPNDNVCGDRDTVSALKPLVGTGQWSVITGTGILQSPTDTSSIVQNLSIGDNKFLWKVSSGSCQAQQDTLTITRNEDVEAIAGGTQTVCTDSVRLNATTPTIGTGQWIIAPPLTVQDENDSKTIANNLKNNLNVFVWLVTNGACVDNDIVFVSYNDDISPSDAGEDQTICDATITNLDAQTAGDAAGSWVITQGTATIDNPSTENSIIRDINDPIIKVVWEISAFGCESSYDTVTIVRDTIAPTIVCPSDTTLYGTNSICAVPFSYTEPIGMDDCPGAITTHEIGRGSNVAYPLGTHTNTYKVTDKTFGLTDQCSFTITVLDTIKPVIACTDTVRLNTDPDMCGTIYTYNFPTASDNCSPPVGGFIVSKTEGLDSREEFPVGISKIIFSTIDSSNNTGTCTTIVTVKDNQKPKITCTNDTLLFTTPNNCEAIVDYALPIATDNCPNPTVTLISELNPFDTKPGATFPVGTTLVGYRVVDGEGKGASCTFNVTVRDTIKPEIICPTNETIFALDDQCGNTFEFTEPIGTDNCQIKSTTGPTSGDFLNLGVNTLTFITTDSSDNTNSCSFDVTVVDTTKPIITCPATITQASEDNLCGDTVEFLLPVVLDNCSTTTVTQTDNSGLSSGQLFPVGTTTISYLVTDTAGNNATCSFDVNIIDNENPTVICPENDTVSTDNNQCTAKYVYDSFIEGVNMSDNCPGVTATQTSTIKYEPNDDFPLGTTTLIFEIEDNSNNITTCSFDVLVEDNEVPSITCPNDTILATADGVCAANVSYTLPTTSDNCTSPTLSFVSGVEQSGTFNEGVTIVTYKVVDNANNEAQCSFNVIVNDNISPEIICKDLDETIFVSSNCKATYNFELNVNDNCDDSPNITQHKGKINGAPLDLGTYDYWFTAKDVSDNISDTCKYTVTVEDNTAPVLTCPSPTPLCAPAVFNFDDATVLDNCSDNLTVNQFEGLTSGNTFPIGIHTISFEATDDSDNRGECTFSVVVIDTTIIPQISGGDTIEVCDTIIPLSVTNTSFGISHSWEILNGQGKLSKENGNSTVLDSVSLAQDVRILMTSNFSGCTTKTDTTLVLFKSPASVSNIKSNYLLCDVSEIELDAITKDAESFKWTQLAGPIVDIESDNLSSTIISGFDNNDQTYRFRFTASTPECRDSIIDFSITASTSPVITVSEDTAVYLGEKVPIEAFVDQDLVSLSWFNNSVFISNEEVITVSPKVTTSYKVFAQNQKGCTANDSVKVVYNDGIFIYNGVTPNDDKVNDTWVIRGMKNYPDALIEVFTQWGQKVYTSDDGYIEPWDATHNGDIVPFGVYYYIINLNDGSKKRTGTITVLR